MNRIVETLYPKGSVNAKRIDTDVFFIDENAKAQFQGHLDQTIRYIEKVQLLDAVLWKRFVEQFRVFSDTADKGWRGEYWGKMMRGAAFTYAYTQNEELYTLLCQTVEDMLDTIDGAGRISTYAEEEELDGWDLWCRKYVLLGMQYFIEICKDEGLKERILASMCAQTDAIMAKIGPRQEGKLPITESTNYWRGLNSSSLLEPVVRLFDLTGEKKYLDFARYIVEEGGTSIANVFELAYADKTDPYQYPITKAYELISCFEGLLEYYRATGIEKYKTAVLNFGRRLMKTDITIIGSAGCTHEYLDHAAARQTDTAYSGIMQETCVTVTWMKFCLQLLAVSGEAAFADCFEQSLYNAYLGAVNTHGNTDKFVLDRYPDAVLEPLPFDSYSSLLPNTRGRGIGGLKVMPDHHYYGCCACIGAAGTGMIAKIASMLSKDGIVLNLYIPGIVETFTPSGQKVILHTVTGYPVQGRVEIKLKLAQEENFNIQLRIPVWSKKTALTVNGQAVEGAAGYVSVKRTWKNDDTIVLELDMRTKVIKPVSNPRDVIFVDIQWMQNYIVPRVVEETPEAKFHIALRRGPLILARDAQLDGTVDEAVDICFDEDGTVELTPSHKAAFDTIVEFSVPQNHGEPFTVIDYSSAGKTWDERSKYACWLPTRAYWKK